MVVKARTGGGGGGGARSQYLGNQKKYMKKKTDRQIFYLIPILYCIQALIFPINIVAVTFFM